MFRNPRRAALLLAAGAAAAGAGRLLDRGDSATVVTVSASAPLRHLLSTAATGLFSSNPLFAPWQGDFTGSFPILNSFASASVPPANLSNHASGGNSDDSRCCPGCLGRNSIANAAAAVGPAVVNISCMQENGWLREKSLGSGTIIDPDGTILTCAHLVTDFQSTKPGLKGKVSVSLQDGREFEGVVLNFDHHSDIAVLKIKSKTPLPAARLGSSCKLRPGDWVVALGCPLSLQNTVTAGIVSCVDRKSSDLGLGGIRREYLQTDCAINIGNSGGPLVNLDGEIIGVNVMKLRDADGLSFSVPIDYVVKIVEHFKKNGRVVRPWLGLKMLDLNPMVIAQLKERSSSFPDVSKGVLVPMVTPGSPAERAGFAPGDVVTEFDGKPVETIKEIIGIMGDKVGVPFKVLVKRANNVPVTLTVTPEEADASR
ncbi:putative protease Do-like 14 isoform X1 [Aegilops tauschii subsp. strangulata]|nr:putative protease Do-like 14 isoform X1 [Aegilops tauschii subsp. strangulata]XP_044373775.1 putative protease Do-like 14 isoform X1 [Triticum aestivum]